ncbi:MAG: MerR family transcriptional regulator [Anaerostipes sp.]
MYSIGEFSKIGSVSTKTLRYYDEIGLLCPAHVNEENHYRYYSQEQVYIILLIGELKSYNLRLEQIKMILDSNDKQLLIHFLEQQIQELDNQMIEHTRLKRSIQKKMQQIQSGGKIMSQKSKLFVEAKEYNPVVVVSKKAVINISEVSNVIGSLYEEIYKNGWKPKGPVMTFYFDKEFDHEHANIEVCIPIEECENAKNHESVKLIQPGMCATCMYTGIYSKLGEAYAAVLKWMEEHGYEGTSAPFDCYMNSPQEVKGPEELITKVCFPMKKK